MGRGQLTASDHEHRGHMGNRPAKPRSISLSWLRNWRGSPRPMASKRLAICSISPALKRITTLNPQAGSPAHQASTLTACSLRRVNADAVEEGTAGMPVGDHAQLLLLIAHSIAQVEIEMALEVFDFVAQFGKPALQGDALAA